jgi:hypothetical protein
MANKKNGFDRQDSQLAKFKFDARSTSNNSAVQQCMRQSTQQLDYKAKQALLRKDMPKFVPNSQAEYLYLQERRKELGL